MRRIPYTQNGKHEPKLLGDWWPIKSAARRGEQTESKTKGNNDRVDKFGTGEQRYPKKEAQDQKGANGERRERKRLVRVVDDARPASAGGESCQNKRGSARAR